MTDTVTTVALRDGVLAAGETSGLVRAWDIATGTLLASVRTGIDQPRGLTLLPGGKAFHLHPHSGLGRSNTRWNNLRVCRGTTRVVPVLPYPSDESVYAPDASCQE